MYTQIVWMSHIQYNVMAHTVQCHGTYTTDQMQGTSLTHLSLEMNAFIAEGKRI